MRTPHTTLRFVTFMKSHLFYILLFFCFASYAQSPQEQRVLQEAKNRNITTQSQALDALQKSGISETQARIIAQQNGISFDEFLYDYFEASNNVVVTSTTSPDPSTSDVNYEADSLAVEENKAFSAPTPPMADPRFFGYAIFDQNPFLEKEYLLGNIDEGYLIAPGDALRIIVFGNNALEFEAVVDRNGNINIPEYGVFFAAGSTFKSLKSRLKVYLGKYFSGLLTAPPKTFLDVSLTQLTPTKVVVTGQVNAPGPHILNTQANPIAALYAAGGVKTSGTLREIRVYRNNRLLKTVDLYGYITSGKLDQDIKLTNNDIVFVGPRLSSVELKGSVKTSALYELKPEETLSDLIEFSGGLPVNTATDRVNVKRTDPATDPTNRYDKKIVTIDYSDLRSTKQSFVMQDGDEVEFFPLLDEVLNTVAIQGNVYNPGTYSLEQFKDLKQLVENAARGVKEDTYFGKVDIKGLLLPSGEETFATYNLSEVLSGAVKVKLKERDLVTVYSEAKVIGAKEVYISGYGVENTDPIAWRENMSVYDLIFENTSLENISFREDLFDDRVDLKTYDYDSRKYVTIPLSFNDEYGLKATFLQPYDKIRLFNKNVLERSTQNVAVYGFVNNAGSFSLEKDMFVEDLILLAGGFQDEADQKVVYVNREELDPTTQEVSTRFIYEVDAEYIKGLVGAPKKPFVLQENDIVSVRKDISYSPLQRISVQGEVNYPRAVIASKEQVSLGYLLEEVGGLTDDALLQSSYAVRDGQVLAVNLKSINKNKAAFQDGDELIISKNYGSVTTQGAVQNPSAFNWDKGKRAKYYIRNSGGKLPKTGGKAYLVSQNGLSQPIGFLKNPKAYPGSKVLVLPKPEREKGNGQFLNDLTNILGVTTGALTTLLLVQRL